MKYDLSNTNDLSRFNTKVAYLIENQKKIDLKVVNSIRSLSQNKYLHVLFALFGIECGLTLEESKTLVKRSCPFMIYSKHGNTFLKKTSKLDKKEMTDFIDWFRTWSAQKGIYLLTSDEYIMQHLFIDNEIERNKEFL